MGRLGCSTCFIVWLFVTPGCVAKDLCYSPGGVAGIVIATFIVTVIICGLILAAAWYFWKRKTVDGLSSRSLRTQKHNPGGVGKFAFDNPYFHHDEIKETTQSSNDRISAGSLSDESYSKMTMTTKMSKPSQISSKFQRQRAVDDTCVGMEFERLLVPLRGHDFTGLGFNICGNMRDGIFVKDVLNRGPANESGKIKAGDRILNVTVSFTTIVYEDALTILSYASPYDVQLEIEKTSRGTQPVIEGVAGKRLGSSNLSSEGERLFHPLYRSQSIDDLTQIEKDSTLSRALAPKRSQTIGLVTQRRHSQFICRERESVNREMDRSITMTTGSLNEKMFISATDKNAHLLKQPSTRSYRKSNKSLFHEKEDVPFFRRYFRMSTSTSEKQGNKNHNLDGPNKQPSPALEVKTNLNSTSFQSCSSQELSSFLLNKNIDSYDLSFQQKGPSIKKQGFSQATGTTVQFHQAGSGRQSTTTETLFSHPNEQHFLKSYQHQNKYLQENHFQSQEISKESLDRPDHHSEIESSLETGNSDISNENTFETENNENISFKSSSFEDLTIIEEAFNESSILMERSASLGFQQKNHSNFDSNKTKLHVSLENIPSTKASRNFVVETNALTPETANSTVRNFIQDEPPLSHHSFCKSREFLECKENHVVENTNQRLDENNQLSNKNVSPSSADSATNLLNANSRISLKDLDFKDKHIKNLNVDTVSCLMKDQVGLRKECSYNRVNVSKSNYLSEKGERISQLALTKHSQHGRSSFTNLSIEIPVIPPVIRQDRQHISPSVPLLATLNPSIHEKEVIEISKDELDDVLISHQDFLIKQTNKTGTCCDLNKKRQRRTDKDGESEYWIVNDESHSYKERANGSHETIKERVATRQQYSDQQSRHDASRYAVKTVDNLIARRVIISGPSVSQHSPEERSSPSSESPLPLLKPP
ncbi:uncharacterized protein LOC143229638 isoform X2 [Tachypleus tridentatus]|uniref:uncharacterized protein LOC143229638 isoform X2 n=1 Tax=Tachypleus tridentatus TaxID=6853 RepID=UPI003FD5D86A